MSDKIQLTTAGIRIEGRVRAPDLDHAVTIIDHLRRGYTVTAKRKDDPLWVVSFMRYPDKAFSNQPDGTTETFRMYVTYWNENAALTDEMPPEWVGQLERYMDIALPSTTYLSRNISLTKETPS